MRIIYNTAAALIIGGLTMGTAVSAQPGSAKEHTVGRNVTLTSCVTKGQTADTFVLTQTADVPVHPATMGRVVYWLDSVKPIRAHVGHQVRITGKITGVEQSQMEVKLGEDEKGGWTVEIEGPGKDVRTSPEKAGVETAGRESGKSDIKTTLVKLAVEEVTMVAASCPAT